VVCGALSFVKQRWTGTSHFFVAYNQSFLVRDINECGKPGKPLPSKEKSFTKPIREHKEGVCFGRWCPSDQALGQLALPVPLAFDG